MMLFKRFAIVGLGMLIAAGAFAKDTEIKTDVVVVGAGSSGLSAAVSAAEQGAKVVVLEKLPYVGGASNLAEGLFGVETDQQRLAAIGLTKEEAFKKAMDFNHYRANGALVSQTINNSANTIKWLEGFGLSFNVVSISPTEGQTWHLVGEYNGAHHGAALIKALAAKAKELGVTIMLETPATSLIMVNGKVQGVRATAVNKDTYTISAKAVVMASGGFNNSKEMVKKYTRFDPDHVFASAPLNKVGDGINMALSAGADHEGEGLMLHPGTVASHVKFLGNIFAMSWQPTLWVNKYGDRFVDETVTSSFALAGNAIERQRDSIGWAIWDDNYVQYTMEKGIDNGIGVLIPIATKLTNFKTEAAAAVAAKSDGFFMADNVADLAKQIGIAPAKLKAAIDGFNRIKETNDDSVFHRPGRTIWPVKTGTLYALKLVPMNFISIGGVKVNLKMEATDKNDQPIPGLYAVGADAGGQFGDSYTLWTSGYMFQWACQSGQLAGAGAADFAKNN